MKLSKLTGLVAALAAAGAAVYWLAPSWLPSGLQPQHTQQLAKDAGKPGAKPGGAAAGGQRGGFGGPTPVSIQQVTLGDVPMSLQASGAVVAQQSVLIRSQVSAMIRRIAVKEGATVAANALLFELDTRSVQADLAKAQAQLAKSQATLADLQRQLSRAQDLQRQNFVSGSAVDSAQTQVGAQQAQVAADEAAVRAQQVQLSLYQIRAPFAGRVGAIDVSPGSLVSAGAGATALATLTQFDPIAVQFSLPESALSAVVAAGTGRPVSVRLASSNPGVDNTVHMGQLSLIDNLVNPATGMLTLKASLPNTQQTLWPGQFVDINLNVATLPNVASIAQSALVLSDTSSTVFVMDDAGKAQVKPVRVLHSMGATVAVSGLAAGDKVVVEGRQNVKPGAMLRDVAQPAKGPTADKAGTGDKGDKSGKGSSANNATKPQQ
jgi:RND family efflux transporter MFP subunit